MLGARRFIAGAFAGFPSSCNSADACRVVITFMLEH